MNVLMLGQSTKLAEVLSVFSNNITIVVETALKTSRFIQEIENYHVIICPTDIFSFKGIWIRVKELKRWVKDTEADIIFSNTRNDMIAAKIYSLIYNRNIILLATSHNSFSWLDRNHVRLMSYAIRFTTDCFISLASFVYNQLLLLGVDENNLILLPNIIEYEKWDIKTDYSISSSFRIAYVACVLPGKRQDFIVEVLHLLENNKYDVVVDCFGNLDDSEYVNTIQENVTKYGLQGKFNLKGCVENSELRSLLKEYDAYFCPSKMEMSPVNILEAQASGLPVIASNVGGIPDMVNDHEDGLLFVWDSLKDAVEKIIELIEDEELRMKIGVAGRKRVSKLYTATIAGEKLLDKIKSYIK